MEQGRETKLTKFYREDFRAVATPNREKPKEEVYDVFVRIYFDLLPGLCFNLVVLKLHLSRRTLQEFLTLRLTGANVKFFEAKYYFFFLSQRLFRYFFLILCTSQCVIQWCPTLQSLLGIPSDGVEYSNFKYEYRVLALRIFEYEYWWLTSSTSTGVGRQLFTLFAVCFFVYLYQRKNIQPNA